MSMNMARVAGRHYLQIPGPTPVPDRVLRAIAMPVLDHRGPEFQKLGQRVLENVKAVFKTKGPVIIYPASGTGAWEAALSNVLSPGDKVLMFETGHFATLWRNMARKLGLDPVMIEADWRSGVLPEQLEEVLREDKAHAIKAVCVVHNETSTGCVSPIAAIRAMIDRVGHPALYMVDTISSLASIDYRHDEWGVDVTVAGSQKGLMLPPGLSFNALSEKAIKAAGAASTLQSFWAWEDMLSYNKSGFFPYTPGTNLLYGLDEALDMLAEEGLDQVFSRHDRHAEATRRAVRAWGLEIFCQVPEHYSSSLTTVLMPAGHDSDLFREKALTAFNISFGSGLTKLAGKVFRIGHLGDTNDLTILAALSAVEMGFGLAGVPHRPGGVKAAMAYFQEEAKERQP